MKLTLLFSLIALTTSLVTHPAAALLGLAIGLGVVCVIACVLGAVAFVRTVNEQD